MNLLRINGAAVSFEQFSGRPASSILQGDQRGKVQSVFGRDIQWL